jgi:thermitase
MCPRDGRLDCQAGHGTFITSLVVQHAPKASVVVANVLDSAGFGREDVIALAIARLGAAGCTLLNLSLCGETDSNLDPVGLGNALRTLSASTVVCCAAGNHGGTACCDPGKLPKGRRLFPAAFARSAAPPPPTVISVGALVDDAPAAIARFSNTDGVTAWSLGQGLPGAYPGGRWMDGRRLRRWAKWSGTSFATPRVAAAIAQRMSAARESAPVAWTAVQRASDPFEGGVVVVPQVVSA